MAALFLRGAPGRAGLPRREWVSVLAALRRHPGPCEQAAGVLDEHRCYAAAVILSEPGLLEWARDLVQSGRCLTVGDELYPRRLLDVLGGSAPPAFWCAGDLSALEGPFASVVGSREVSREVENFARRAGYASAQRGFTLVSGGAHGCDRFAEQGALKAGGRAVRILPRGIAGCSGRPGLLLLSVCPPSDDFSTAAAMERNALIYAFSDRSLVVQTRFREGGTWHGAVDALRRRRTSLFYRDTGETWARAFLAMGARPVVSPAEFLSLPLTGAFRGGLFEVA